MTLVPVLCSSTLGLPLISSRLSSRGKHTGPTSQEPQRLLLPLVKQLPLSADRFLLYISFEFLAAASGPVVTMKGSLHQGSHNTPHCCLISTSVPLPIVLHSQPVTKNRYQSPGSFCSSAGKNAVKKTVSRAHVMMQNEIVLCSLQISPVFQTDLLWCQKVRTLWMLFHLYFNC